jgi:hypothetical protein
MLSACESNSQPKARGMIQDLGVSDGKNPDNELKILRTLCDEAVPRAQRLQLLHSIQPNRFEVPEYAIVFESIRALLSLGPITAAHLRVHLTRRGFPDTDVEKYFEPESKSDI